MTTQIPHIPAPLSILKRPEVQARTGLSRSTIYFRISQGTFPGPINLGGRAVGWLTSEVDAWIKARVAATRGVLAPTRE